MSQIRRFSSPYAVPSALGLAAPVSAARVLAILMIMSLVALLVALVLTPWQQSVAGTGRVIAYAPLERQQDVEAPISGRVMHWYVQEGQHVEAGEPIAQIADNDPSILERLQRERDAVQAQIDATQMSILVTEDRITALSTAQSSAVDNARLRVRMAEDQRDAAEQAVDAARATLRTAEINLTRQRRLQAKGLASDRELELAELSHETARTGLQRAEASLRAARSNIKARAADRDKVNASNQASIESARASLASLRTKRSEAEAKLAKVDVRLSRQQQMRVDAPRSGTILRLVAKQGTEMVKQGDPLVLLVPDTNARAVELWVDGNDAPLITSGRHVRVQFEGWPAVQFVGWPSVAVGTFGGTVSFVDATDDGKGRFRVVVVPDGIEDWPEGRYLRQGVRANGWVLLNQVSLGFELWRQLNGFPPVVASSPDPLSTGKGGKGGKDGAK